MIETMRPRQNRYGRPLDSSSSIEVSDCHRLEKMRQGDFAFTAGSKSVDGGTSAVIKLFERKSA